MAYFKQVQLLSIPFILILWGTMQVSFAQNKASDSDGNELTLDGPKRKELILFLDACKERSLGNMEEAARKFLEVITINEKNAVARFELAKLLEEKNKNNEALLLINQALSIEPKNTYFLEFKADLLGKLGKIKESVKTYEKIVKIQPANVEILYKMANTWLISGAYEKAVESYNRVEAITGVDEQMSLQKEKIWLQLNKLDKAENEIKKLIEAYPAEVRYYNILAELYRANNLPDKAFEVYTLVEKISPDEAFLSMQLADYYRSKGEKEKSFSYLKKSFLNKNLDIDTKMKVLISYYTLTESSPKLKDQAYELLAILAEVHSNDAKAFAVYGDFLYRDERLLEARKHYARCLELDKKRYPVWSQYLLILSQLNENDTLVKSASEAIELFPVESFSYLLKGIALIQLKKFYQALEALKEGKIYAMERPVLGQFWTSMGDAYNEVKEHTKSDSCYQESLKLDPNNANVLNNFSYYLSVRKLDLEKAKEMSKKSNDLEPNNSSYQDTYGWILFQLGDYSNAKIWIEKAIANGGEENGTLLEHLGDVEAKLGDLNRASEFWQKALKAGGTTEFIEKKIKEGKFVD